MAIVPMVVKIPSAVQGTFASVFVSPRLLFVELFPSVTVTVLSLCAVVIALFLARGALCWNFFTGKIFGKKQLPSGELEPQGGIEPTPTLHGNSGNFSSCNHVEGSGPLHWHSFSNFFWLG